MAILRGELYFVELGPTRGREIDLKRRPAVVLSINDINRKPLVVTVVPGTSRDRGSQVYRHEVRVDPSATNGLTNSTVFQCFQMKALDHVRFDQPPIGVVSSVDLRNIEDTVKLCLGLP
jgi:mRNA interferase MazF